MINQAQFRTEQFLREHILQTFGFYHPGCIDRNGGFYHYFRDDGSLYNQGTRHLVSSTRFVFNYALAAIEFKNPAYLDFVRHGLKYIEEVHRNRMTGGYAWLIEAGEVTDNTNHCYGLAFVLLVNSLAVSAGAAEAAKAVERTWDLLEERYWEPAHGLYKDEISGDFKTVSPYRGQNANMHMCEAMLAAYEATNDRKFLDRAYALAAKLNRDLASSTDGLIWEHYDENWNIDLDYNRDDPKHLYRPWGFLPGHQTEWSKLLLILHRHRPEAWMPERAQHLFDTSMKAAWDEESGGIWYTFGPDYAVCDTDKYYWVHAESFAAAALLALHTGQEVYWDWYDRIWEYSYTHMVDRKYGAWYRILKGNNEKYGDEKSPAGKSDYHTLGACFEVLKALRR